MTPFVLIALSVATAFDIVTTIRAKAAGAIEGNPALRWAGPNWIGLHIVASVVVGLAVLHYDNINWVGLAVAAILALAGLNNMRNVRKLQAGATGQAQPNGAATGASGAEADQPRRGGSRRNHG